MLQPTRTKYRKSHKGRIHGNASRGEFLNYGSYGLKAMEPERIISKQIEAARVSLTRFMKRTGKVWLRIFPNIPVSKKPTEVRMGKGKGSPEYWVCRVKPGRIIFEIDGVSESVAREALYKASTKLPIKTKFVKRYQKMKNKEIDKLSVDELKNKINSIKKDLFNFRFRKVNAQSEDTSKVSQLKKDVAKLLTKLYKKD